MHIRCVVIVCIHQIYFCLNKKRVSKDPVLGIFNQKQTSGWCSNWVQYTHKRQFGRLWRYLCYGADLTRNSQQKYALLIPSMMHVWCHTIKCRGTFGESKDRSIVLKNWNKENTNDEHQTSYDFWTKNSIAMYDVFMIRRGCVELISSMSSSSVNWIISLVGYEIMLCHFLLIKASESELGPWQLPLWQ